MIRVAVIGAGPAGMMAAMKAAEGGASVKLIEKMDRPGRKMRITGKGRCNVTNASDLQEIIKNIQGNGKFLMSSLHAFNSDDVMHFFEECGVPLKVERGNRVFPVSDRAQDAVNALVMRLHELGVDIETGIQVSGIVTSKREGGGRRVIAVRLASGREIAADAIIVATGGASYPATGSTGDGYRIAESLGHTITEITPALVPLETEEQLPLQGLSLKNVAVTLFANGKEVEHRFGEMMFTHFGVTGPVILSISRTAAKALAHHEDVELRIDMKPALSHEKLDARLQRDFQKYIRKTLKNAMMDLLPHRMIETVIDLAFLDPDMPVHQLSKKDRMRLVDTLKCISLTVTKTRPIAEAIVTAGGVSVKEINPKTMESKLVHGLYFAGEVVDVDGYTGGYNLQAAFSMGAAAGRYAADGR